MDRAFELLERISTLLRTGARAAGQPHGLQPVHLQALRYLGRCNRYSDSPAAVTEYLGLTKGTVSQTLNVLEERGLVEKSSDPDDGRRVHLRLTAQGRKLLRAAATPAALLSAGAALAPGDRARLEAGLEALLRALQVENGGQPFGLCRTCRHFQVEPGGARCGLTREPLSERDAGLLCREHTATT